MNIWAAVVLAIVIAILCGTLTGFFIAYCGVQAMVATLGGSFLYAGLALMVSTLSDTPSYWELQTSRLHSETLPNLKSVQFHRDRFGICLLQC